METSRLVWANHDSADVCALRANEVGFVRNPLYRRHDCVGNVPVRTLTAAFLPAAVGRQTGGDRQLDRNLRAAPQFALQADPAAVLGVEGLLLIAEQQLVLSIIYGDIRSTKLVVARW